MKVKFGVSLFGLKLPMRKVHICAERIWKKYGQELVITSTTDGVHSAGSLHPFGYAEDLRTYYFKRSTKRKAAAELQEELGEDYQVLIRFNHIHVEYQKILDDTGF